MAEKKENTLPAPDLQPLASTSSCAIVVASFRAGSLINRCLHSLLAQEGVPSPEIIVVDSSGDGAAARMREAFPTVTVIELPRQTPQSAARNIGIGHTQAQFIAITDQDCVAPPDWLFRLLSWHGQGDYVAVGGAIGNGTPESAVGTASYLIEFNEFLPTGTPRLVEMIPHCNICFRRDVFTNIGPFVEAPPGAEDLIYNFLIRQQGGRLLFDPSIVVTHLNRADFPAFLRHQRMLGFGSATARRTATLKGQLLVRYPALAYGLPFVRLGRTASRLLLHNRPMFLRYLQLLPFLVPGYLRWTAGFLAGLRYTPPPQRLDPTPSVAASAAETRTARREPQSL